MRLNKSAVKNKGLYRRVAQLHIANINQGFLATLGIDFLALMYEAIDQCDSSVLLVSTVEGEVIGFVSGATGMGPIYRRMLRKWPSLLVALLPSLLSPRRVWRILEVLRYSGGTAGSTGLPSAELLSLVVDPAFRGNSHAENLYRALCEHFTLIGLPAFKIVVGAALTTAHRFYSRMGAQAAAEVAVHRGSMSTVYVHKIR